MTCMNIIQFLEDCTEKFLDMISVERRQEMWRQFGRYIHSIFHGDLPDEGYDIWKRFSAGKVDEKMMLEHWKNIPGEHNVDGYGMEMIKYYASEDNPQKFKEIMNSVYVVEYNLDIDLYTLRRVESKKAGAMYIVQEILHFGNKNEGYFVYPYEKKLYEMDQSTLLFPEHLYTAEKPGNKQTLLEYLVDGEILQLNRTRKCGLQSRYVCTLKFPRICKFMCDLQDAIPSQIDQKMQVSDESKNVPDKSLGEVNGGTSRDKKKFMLKIWNLEDLEYQLNNLEISDEEDEENNDPVKVMDAILDEIEFSYITPPEMAKKTMPESPKKSKVK
jgi:hypothetical protein